MRWWLFLLVAFAALMAGRPARAEASAAYCRRVGTDDALQPVPPALVPAFLRAFDLHMPPEIAGRLGRVRCAGGAVLACSLGANLPCGKANTSQRLPAADEFCRDNHDPDTIPAYVTGHDTIYQWRCRAGRAVAVGPVAQVDDRGFIAAYWRRLN